MSSDSDSKLTRYVSATTIVTSDVANMWSGGLYGTSEASLHDPDHPLVAGHVHDGVHVDGHAQRIHLVDNVTDQITIPNIGDKAITPRTVNEYSAEVNAIPYITLDGTYKLNLSMITPMMGFGAFIEVEADNLIKHTSEDYSYTGRDFVFGSSSLDDIGAGAGGIEEGDHRFLFDRGIGAFRAGSVSGANSDLWDEANRGPYSVVIGVNSAASGMASVAFGNQHIVAGNYSGALSGWKNDTDVDSHYSAIVGGSHNTIYKSTYSSIAGGEDSEINNSAYSSVVGGTVNEINNSAYSSVVAGRQNYMEGEACAVGGRGIRIADGIGTFVWGYDEKIQTNPVTGDQMFIIGTGAGPEEAFRLGVNTDAPHPLGEAGAHIKGNPAEGSSPLKLENLSHSTSQDALCVDEDGNVFISDHQLCEGCGVFEGEKTSTYWIGDISYISQTFGGDDPVVLAPHIFNTDDWQSGMACSLHHRMNVGTGPTGGYSGAYIGAKLRNAYMSGANQVRETVVIPFDLPVGQTLEKIVLIGEGLLDDPDNLEFFEGFPQHPADGYTFTIDIFRQKEDGGCHYPPLSTESHPLEKEGWDEQDVVVTGIIINSFCNLINISFDGFTDGSGGPIVNDQSSSIMNTYYARIHYTYNEDTPYNGVYAGDNNLTNTGFYVLGINATTSFTSLEGALGVTLT